MTWKYVDSKNLDSMGLTSGVRKVLLKIKEYLDLLAFTVWLNVIMKKFDRSHK